MREKIEKYIKWKKVFLMIIAVYSVAAILVSAEYIFEYVPMDSSLFEVKLTNDEQWHGKYCLFINGENMDIVNYNDYMGDLDENGNPNVKLCVILYELKQLTHAILLFLIFILVYFLFEDVVDLLSKKNLARIRKIGILSILLTILPNGIVAIGKSNYFIDIESSVTPFPYVFLIGVFLIIFARLLEYWNTTGKDDVNITKI
jgi:hypothetical protein